MSKMSNIAYTQKVAGRLLKAVMLCCGLIFCSFQAGNKDNEYKLKAAFLYNFIQYIDWGNTAPANEYTICIVGTSPIDAPLREIAATRKDSEKKIKIVHCKSAAEITYAHILFISKNVDEPLDAILAKVPKGTLTVGERPGCAKEGAAMNFVIIDNKLKFESNLKALNASGLKASSQLLKLAIITE